jgi:prolycopene isomerase
MKAIIIGSGISGLIAGSYLVENGWEVTIYEQNNLIGGVTSQIEKGGFKWDLGQMLIEGIGSGEPIGLVLSELGIFDKVKTIRTERAYIFPDFDLYKPEKYSDLFWRREKLKELFPSDAEGLDNYYKFYVRMMEIATLARKSEGIKGIKSILLKIRIILKLLPVLTKKGWNAQRMSEYYFKSKKLQSIFLSILADFVAPPSQFLGLGIPFVNPEAAFDENMPLKVSKIGLHPSYRYVLGGMASLVNPIIEVIKKKDGKFQLRKTVNKIIIERGKAIGILCKDGTKDTADLIIASGGAKEILLDTIDQENIPDDFIFKVKDLPLMESILMVHLGVNFDPSPYQKLSTVYYYGTYDVDEAIKNCRQGIYHEGRDGFVIFIPTYFSPELAPSGHHTITIYTIAPDVLNKGSWKERKEELAEKLLIEAEKVIPGLREHTTVKIILTPDDFKIITHLKHHAFGGASPIMGKSVIPHKTPIQNLWFIGAQSQSGAGLPNIIADTARTMKSIFKSFKK